MTIVEQHYDFKLKIDKVDSQSREDFNVAEIDWLINEARNVAVKRRHRLGFELNQKRVDDLSTIHIKHPLQPDLALTDLGDGVYELPLASLAFDYLFFTRGEVEVIDANCDPNPRIGLRAIQNDDLDFTLDDPFNEASKLNLIPYNFGRSSAGTGRSMYIYAGTLTLGIARLEYLKVPQKTYFGGYTYIDGSTPAQTNSELPEHMHSEVVDIAVQIAAGIIEHPTYVQLKSQKVFEQE